MRFFRPQTLVLMLGGIIIVAWLGEACLTRPFAGGLARLSYDLPFVIRSNVGTPEICVVTMDEKAARALQQPMGAPWDRRLHAHLVRTLAEAGAKAIIFDVVFDPSSADPAVDEEFAAAMRENGRVFLGAAVRSAPGRAVVEEQVIPPIPALRRAAAGWGLLELRPVDPDYGIRQIFPGNDDVPAATWRLARHLGAPLPETPEVGERPRWLNYYAPAGMFPSVSYHEALRPEELAPNFFRNRIVMVGARLALGNLDQQRDEYLTPYTRWGQPFAAGVEVHATTLLNFLRGDWLRRMNPHTELWFIVLFGAGISVMCTIICAFCPFRTAGAAGVAVILVAGLACWSAWTHRVWFDWLVPVAIQTPVALFWALGTNYVLEVRRRGAIRRAFALYLRKLRLVERKKLISSTDDGRKG